MPEPDMLERAPIAARSSHPQHIVELISHDFCVDAAANASSAERLFEAHPDIDALAVVGCPRLGLLTRACFFRRLRGPFGYAVFENRPLSLLADEALVVDAQADPVATIKLATERPAAQTLDDIVVTEQGRFRGVVSMRSLLVHNKQRLIESVTHVARLDDENRRLQHVAERAVQDSQRLLQQIADSLPAVLFVFDLETDRLQYVNSEGASVLGWTRGGVPSTTGRALLGLVHPDDRPRVTALASDLLTTRGRQIVEVECRLHNDEGHYRWFQGRLTHLAAHDDTSLPRLLGVAQDVTDRRTLEAQLVQAQKMECVGRLAGGIAHDFNNILTIVMGFAEMAGKRAPGSTEAVTDLQCVVSAAKRGAGLTNRLMAFVRPAASAPSIVNLADLIVQLDPLLRRLVGVRVELVALAAPDLGGVRLAPGPFEQVLMNLVANARDATDKGGKITIAARNATVDASSIHWPPACPPGEYVVVSVRDTGSGMDDETLTHIFEPFFTTKPPGQGTGLGLATCYAIVMQSGGHFRVESAPGCGTTVEIYWPRLPLGAMTEPSARVPETRAEGHETILVVEDEPAVRALAIEALRQQGYAVLDAENGEHALGVVAAHDGAIDLLVTDIVMPRLGGRELARRLLAERPGLRVLFMSGYIEDNAFLHEVEGGGAAFLQKPFMPQTLTVKVREVLEAGAPRPACSAVLSA